MRRGGRNRGNRNQGNRNQGSRTESYKVKNNIGNNWKDYSDVISAAEGNRFEMVLTDNEEDGNFAIALSDLDSDSGAFASYRESYSS